MGNGTGIPTHPQAPPPAGESPGGGNTNPSGNTGNSGGSGSNSGGGGGNPYLAAQNKANRKAANSYMQQAQMLNVQAAAIRRMLNGGFEHALEIALRNVRLTTRQQQHTLVENYHDRLKDLKGAANDNRASQADQSAANQTNSRRERASALSEAMLQGAGESDVLRSQQMSLRNWDANQSEVERSYFDTLRSINSNLTDLNSDTKTARQNVAIEANSDIEGLWTGYYAQQSEAYTDLGNILGQQATLYSQAQQYGGKGANKKRKHSVHAMGVAVEGAADAASQHWRSPGIPKNLRNWEGHDPFAGRSNLSEYHGGTTTIAPARPEGATLREWA